jgi:hypothetical protein
MGIPQPLVAPLRDIEQADVSRPVETLLEDTGVSFQETLSLLSRAARDLEWASERIKEANQEIQKEAERDLLLLDEHLDSVTRLEESLKREWLPQIELARSIKAGTFRLPMISPEQKSELVTVLERFTQVFLAILRGFRDLRWNLMALRAEVEDPGDAPVFDNAQDLLGYLKTLPK